MSPNRLAQATSPYLLQHADNPVDWYEWGEEALARARAEDKPILLSIGYAACHWCHVMERESFEDEATAELMNRHFVCVKVDREERPDLDAIYMDAVQAMTGHGGWPMTVFLTPDGKPFYAGTYFPNEDRHGMPAFRRVLESVAEAWRTRREDVLVQGQRVIQEIGRVSAVRPSNEPLSEEILLEAYRSLERQFDPTWGGFGGAPKFPQPMTLEFLLRAHLRDYAEAVRMIRTTLDRMAAGGMYDQIGGGFHRYSVDARWHVPHFEKMLYDNAQLASLYARAWQVTRESRYERVAQETIDYLLREMRHPDGAFFSSQDADSEGIEGKFFVWPYEELVEVGGEAVAAYFGAIREGNWEGTNVLWTPLPPATVAAEFGLSVQDLERRVDDARRRLFEIREKRVRPATDDKILCAWNGLAIATLADAGAILGRSDYVEAAVRAAEFVLSQLRRDDGRLVRTWRDGRPGGPGYCDDYALMAAACLSLGEATLEIGWILRAKELADEMFRLFADAEGGGFFQTGADAEQLVIRPKELFDNAVPAGNSVAADVLQRLGYLFGNAEYEQAGVGALRLVREYLARSPTGFGRAICALDFYLSPVREVALVGEPGREDIRRLAREVWDRFMPSHVFAAAQAGDPDAKQVPLLEGRDQLDGKATAYVCERFVCQRPVTEPEELAAQLTG